MWRYINPNDHVRKAYVEVARFGHYDAFSEDRSPFRYVDAETAPAIVARLGRLQMKHGARFAPSALLQEHARTGARFYDE